MGDDVPFFGDHVEASDGGNDFASTLGVGGVVGTQFVLPSLVTKHGKSDLTPAREKDFEKWLGIYREKMLSKGQYLGQLYDIGFDVPETHVIRKDQTMYYAFFAKQWKGTVDCVASKTATTAWWTMSRGKTWGPYQDIMHICRLSLQGICCWKRVHYKKTCLALLPIQCGSEKLNTSLPAATVTY